jgi:hypothetical protein
LFGPLLAATYGHQGTPAAVPVPHTWPSYYWYIGHYGQPEAVRRAHAWHQGVGGVPSVRVNFREYGLDPVALAILKGEPLSASKDNNETTDGLDDAAYTGRNGDG